MNQELLSQEIARLESEKRKANDKRIKKQQKSQKKHEIRLNRSSSFEELSKRNRAVVSKVESIIESVDPNPFWKSKSTYTDGHDQPSARCGVIIDKYYGSTVLALLKVTPDGNFSCYNGFSTWTHGIRKARISFYEIDELTAKRIQEKPVDQARRFGRPRSKKIDSQNSWYIDDLNDNEPITRLGISKASGLKFNPLNSLRLASQSRRIEKHLTNLEESIDLIAARASDHDLNPCLAQKLSLNQLEVKSAEL